MKLLKFDEFLLEKDYSDKTREKYAEEGFAMEDGSYPIKTIKDLENACKRYLMVKGKNSKYDLDKQIINHIIKRSKTFKIEGKQILTKYNL